MLLTLLLIGAGGFATAVGTACALSDGKDHTSELSRFENDHPYSAREMNEPYCP